jgi:Flp pilus assembly protein CpaB
VALKVNPASVVAGFVLPNSRVDVVQTIRSGEGTVSQTILQNMLVLASDTMLGRPEDKQSNMASTVTLAAKPEDAQKLRLAEAVGELSLSLRGTEDHDIVALKPARPQDLSKNTNTNAGPEGEDDGSGTGGLVKGVPDVPAGPTAPAPQDKVKEEAPPAPPKTVTQIIYNGESVTKTIYVLNKDGDVSTEVEKTGLEREPRAAKKEPAAGPEKGQAEADPKGKADKGDAEPKAKPEGVK